MTGPGAYHEAWARHPLEATRAAGEMLLPLASDTATQFADHLMWGALLGATLRYRRKRRDSEARRDVDRGAETEARREA